MSTKYLQYKISNEILIDIFKQIKYPINTIRTCKKFHIIITDPSCTAKWVIHNFDKKDMRYFNHLVNTNPKKIKEKHHNEIKIEINKLLRESANLKNIEGCYTYGEILYYGKLGNEIDKISGIEHIRYAAKKDYKPAIDFLK